MPGLAAILSVAITVNALALEASGAGATFPYAVYTSWAVAYKEASGNTVNCQGIGSSGGIKADQGTYHRFWCHRRPPQGRGSEGIRSGPVPVRYGRCRIRG